MNQTHRLAAVLGVVLGASALGACTVTHTQAASTPPPPTPEPYRRPVVIHRPAARPTPAAQPVRSWSKLGEVRADGRGDRDTVWVRGWDDRFRTLSVRVDRSDVRLQGLVVEFENGSRYSPSSPNIMTEGDTYTFDLPGKSQRVKAVHFKYGTLRGFGRAQVQVWGR